MKSIRVISSLFLFSCIFVLGMQAQTGYSTVKEALDAALKEHIKDVYPKKGCECNDCRHRYAGSYKVSKHATVKGTMRVDALAKIVWKNTFTAGEGVVPVYAEFKKKDGQVFLSKLRWRKGGCMPWEVLVNGLQ
ncbi:MAG: hypothetical protein AAF587_20115 [Bacteroidota bacterium]